MSDAAVLNTLETNNRFLWAGAILCYGVGDTVTTFWGLLVSDNVAEIGPVAGPLMEAYGIAALLLIKAVVFLGGYLLYALLRTPGRVAVPLALFVVGIMVTGWNVFVIIIG